MDNILILSGIILTAFLKALRDIDLFRWQNSIFAEIGWANQFRNREGIVDWFHMSDGAIFAVFWIVAAYLFTHNLILTLISYIVFRLIFYRIFNFLFHFLFTRKKHRDWGKKWYKI